MYQTKSHTSTAGRREEDKYLKTAFAKLKLKSES